MTPYYILYRDMRWPEAWDDPLRGMLVVRGFQGDVREYFGIPASAPKALAIDTARQRGWKLTGIWQAKGTRDAELLTPALTARRDAV